MARQGKGIRNRGGSIHQQNISAQETTTKSALETYWENMHR
jgi:hypothetical protein